MKALFYTATAVFITLAGVIAYFALQSPASVGGARVVLDIDASGMPDMPAAGNAKAAFDPYPGAEEDKPADPAASTAAPSAQEPPTASAEPAAPPEEVVAAHESPAALPAAQEKVPEPPPGTALAGLNKDRPLFREVQPDPQQTASAEPAPASAEGADAKDAVIPDPAAGASLMQSQPEGDALRAAADAQPKDAAPPATRGPAIPSSAEIATLLQEAETHAVPAPVPPVPVRRPNGIPAPGEQVAAAGGGGWTGVQTSTATGTTDSTSTKPPARVALLLRNVGRLDQDSADAIGSLPSAISLGFWPYASDGKRLAARAQERGHEVIVQLPLEPSDYPTSNAGPDTLLTTSPPEQNAERLDAVLKRFEGNTGVTNLMGGKMLQTKAALKPLLEELKARGLIYVGENSNSHATARQVAREINLRFGAAEVMIDAQPAPEAIDKALARLVGIAKQRGSAIGIGNATVVTVQQVHEWADTLAGQGVTLVPVGALTQTPGSS